MTKLSTMLSNPEKYFNELIKALIACEVDSSGDDDWKIVHHIEDLPNETEYQTRILPYTLKVFLKIKML